MASRLRTGRVPIHSRTPDITGPVAPWRTASSRVDWRGRAKAWVGAPTKSIRTDWVMAGSTRSAAATATEASPSRAAATPSATAMAI